MSNLAERLRLERRKEVVLQTGRKVGYHLPDLQEFVLQVGRIPTPALQGEKPTEEEALKIVAENPEAIAQTTTYVKLVVGAMLDDIDGEAIDKDDDRAEIVELLEPIERQELFLIAIRDDSGKE